MMTLHTSPELLEAQLVRVFWRTGGSSAGIVDVQLTSDTPDNQIIAELCAIRYLAFEQQVFNRKPLTGKGYRFVVSTGAIRKIVLGKSSKKDLWPYARFLSETMPQAEIIVKRDIDKVSPEDNEVEVEHIFADPKDFASPIEISFDTPNLGEVRITKHAVERFIELGNKGSDPIKRPLVSLQRRLTNEDIVQVTMPKQVAEHKIRKYGDLKNAECWKRPGSTLHFQVSNSNGERTLVTCFRRNDFY